MSCPPASHSHNLLPPHPSPPCLQVQARYSFVYRLINGDWKISEHHSSAMPEPIAAVEEAAAELELVGENPAGGRQARRQAGRQARRQVIRWQERTIACTG